MRQICELRDVVYKGYCVGSIQSEEANDCHTTFFPGGYPLALKSAEAQEFLFDNRETIVGQASELVIGLTTENGIARFANF